MEIFAIRVKTRRDALGLTQGEVAKRSGHEEVTTTPQLQTRFGGFLLPESRYFHLLRKYLFFYACFIYSFGHNYSIAAKR